MHEGCTARTWLHLAVTANSPVETEGLDADETLVVTGGVEHAPSTPTSFATCSPVVR